MLARLSCKRPDRDAPGIICGYPLPCPWHTVTIDTSTTPAQIIVPVALEPAVNQRQLKRLKKIALTLKGALHD